MLQKVCMVAAVLFSAVSASFDFPQYEDGVLVLTDKNIDEEIAKNQYLMIEFYAPWCPHCKKLTPEYSAAAEVLAKNDPPIVLAKIDETQFSQTGDRFGVKSYPTLFWFVNGQKQLYDKGRNKDDIVKWALKKTLPASTKVTCDALKEKVAESKFLLAFFGPDTIMEDSAFIRFAQTEENVVFVHTEDPHCAAQFGAGTPGIVFFRTFEEEFISYEGANNKDKLASWVKSLMIPTVFEYAGQKQLDEFSAVLGKLPPRLQIFRSESDKSAAFMTVFEEAARANRGKMLFSYSGVSDGVQATLANAIGATSDELPSLWVIQSGADMKKYKCEVAAADMTVESITQIVDERLSSWESSGAISPEVWDDKSWIKTKEPEVNDGPLTVVVGMNFDEIVMDKTKDVLVKFYAPWCPHCKKIVPLWNELAEAYKDVPDLVIADFDATVNDVKSVPIKKYPTLIFFNRNNAQFNLFLDEGDEVSDIMAWLQENSGILKEKAGHFTDEL